MKIYKNKNKHNIKNQINIFKEIIIFLMFNKNNQPFKIKKMIIFNKDKMINK
jgi:hypothetical protein